MKVEYDVELPKTYCGKYKDKLKEFYESDHYNARWEFENEEEAKKCHAAICMFTSRNKIYDLVVTRRKNILYLIKDGANG